jgi:hypothetical protein
MAIVQAPQARDLMQSISAGLIAQRLKRVMPPSWYSSELGTDCLKSAELWPAERNAGEIMAARMMAQVVALQDIQSPARLTSSQILKSLS